MNHIPVVFTMGVYDPIIDRIHKGVMALIDEVLPYMTFSFVPL